ncbi:hypothetical protein [Puniceibacterium sp. IMCC21224]|uniref:hypothetical protein n=1 Tax=Puniceibacterium sp. IMCC21224 TaxID=1618204 RepID=UPI00065D2FD2|nr:hypothetical protein [Puniceibacterium sp. IMCC21224]KMK66946.1 hypothetical protein IMCC21224_111807 [Puniceibacterium sp. IMCC21224]
MLLKYFNTFGELARGRCHSLAGRTTTGALNEVKVGLTRNELENLFGDLLGRTAST